MTNPILPRAMRFTSSVLLLAALVISSCRTAPKAPTRISAIEKEYAQLLQDQLGRHWYRLAEINGDYLSPGTVETRCDIPAAGGRVRNLKVTANTGSRLDEQIARSAIEKLRAPPIPPGILARSHQDHFVLETSFTVFDKAKPIPSPTPPKKR